MNTRIIGLTVAIARLSVGLFTFVACTSSSDTRRDSSDSGADAASSECPSSCDDGFSCTIDTCHAGTCTHSIGPNSGATACSAGHYCTLNDGCIAAPACATDAQCTQSWAGDACKSNIRCEGASSVCTFTILDKDGDGYPPPVCGGSDCDDSNSSTFPEAQEICNGVDDDCDGNTDEDTDGSCGPTQQCADGTCVCRPANMCNGNCVDIQIDNKNCGRCGVTCVGGTQCISGGCACPEGIICGELFRAIPSNDPATILTIHQGYIIHTRMSVLAATSIAEPTKEEGLVWAGYVDAALGDGNSLFFSGGIQCTRGAMGCTGITGRLDFAYTLSLTEPMSIPATFLPMTTRDLIIHGDNAYWRMVDGIFSAPKLDSPGTPTMVNSLSCAALAGDDSALYCATEETSVGSADGVLYRLGYDGSNPTIVAGELEIPSRVQVSGGFVYWTDRSLSRIATDGTSKMTAAKWDTDYAVSNFIVDGNNIFYVYGGLKVMTITGQNVRSIGSATSVRGYAIDSTHIYWAGDDGIYRASKPD